MEDDEMDSADELDWVDSGRGTQSLDSSFEEIFTESEAKAAQTRWMLLKQKHAASKKNDNCLASSVLKIALENRFTKAEPQKMHEKKPSLTQFRNCRILRDSEIIREDLWVRDGQIINPEKIFFDEQRAANVQIDCGNAIIAPGFIDVQINGAFGVDFSSDCGDLTEESIQKVAKNLLPHGVTSFCPTVITSPSHLYKQILPLFKKRNGSKDGAGILGLHLEGPFISPAKKGAHKVEFMQTLDGGIDTVIKTYGKLDDVAIVTLAPELPNAEVVINELVIRGITVSIGHSVANLAQGEAAVQAGARFITHLFNSMVSFHHRDPHLVGLLASDNIPSNIVLHYGIISDGVHTHPAALRIAHRVHPKGIVAVTDAIPAMGLTAGSHHFGPQTIEIRDNKAFVAGTDTLCGSIATMNECVKFFHTATDCTTVEALEAGTLHPARVLGITDKKGTLEFNTDGDFIMLDDDLKVKATYIAGENVWQQE